ncbi:MAG: DUF190 domain-containing protein [bacterium]|nr:DUF190 domain-containing protein [bacterium]
MRSTHLIRVYLAESERRGNRPLYQAIVERLKTDGYSGCVVFKGIEGFGPRGIRSARVLALSQDLPVVIEVVETESRRAGLLALFDELVTEGLVTSERIELLERKRREDAR